MKGFDVITGDPDAVVQLFGCNNERLNFIVKLRYRFANVILRRVGSIFNIPLLFQGCVVIHIRRFQPLPEVEYRLKIEKEGTIGSDLDSCIVVGLFEEIL